MREAILMPTAASGKEIAEVPRERNPLTLIHAARYALEGMRTYLSPSDDWRTPLRVEFARTLALDDLWLVGQIVARLTVLVESCGSSDPDLFLDLADRAEDLNELRADIGMRRASRPRSDAEGADVLSAPLPPVGTAPREWTKR